MSTLHRFLSAFALASCLPLLAQQTGQKVDAEKALVDHDYRFALDHPGEGWRLLDEAAAKKFVPDAVAGIMRPEGVFAVVIAERAPATDLKALAEMLIGGMSLMEREVASNELIRYRDLDAARYDVKGTVNGLPLWFNGTVFVSRGWLFQLLTWTRQDIAAGGRFAKAAHDAFRLLDGEIRVRVPAVESIERDGVGWRLRGQRYRNAIYRLEVEPAPPWRVVVGDELRQMNDAAAFGLVCLDPEAYLVAIPERIVDADEAALRASLRAGLDETGAFTGETVERSVGGTPVSFRRYAIDAGLPIVLHHGVLLRDGICTQLQYWYQPGQAEAADKAAAAALAKFRLLDAKACAALAEELAKGDDPQTRVGPDFSYRGGVYRNFSLGLQWSPPRRFWRVSPGDLAQVESPGAVLAFEEMEHSLFGLVFVEQVGDFDAAEFHDAVVAEIIEEAPAPAVTKADRGGVAYRRSTLEMDGVTYVVDTAVSGGIGYKFLLWGFPANVKAAIAVASGAQDSFRVEPAGLAAVVETEREIRDQRLGFALRRPDVGWTTGGEVPEGLAPIGTIATWEKGGRSVFCIALSPLTDNQDADWFRSFVGGLIISRFAERTAMGEPETSATEVAGAKAERSVWQIGREMVELVFVVRGGIFYALGSAFPASDESPARAADQFRFLD